MPLDVRRGLVDRFITPDLEEQCAYAAALLVPKEVERLLAKIFLEAPSAKAIQRVIEDTV